jgi:hypothetical protein
MMSLKAMRLSKPKTIFRFGVLQLRVGRVEILHPRVIASEVYYFNILQVSVRALFILQAKVLLVAVHPTVSAD